MSAKIEFKYDRTPENTAKQLAGELYGLKALNGSNLVPRLSGNVLTIEAKGLNPAFFKNPQDLGRESAFAALEVIFNQTEIYGKITEDETEQKVLIKPCKIIREGAADKLIIAMPVEKVNE
jgi:hypothetical protein